MKKLALLIAGLFFIEIGYLLVSFMWVAFGVAFVIAAKWISLPDPGYRKSL